MCNKRYISKPQNKEIRSVSGKTDSLMSFFLLPVFLAEFPSGAWVPSKSTYLPRFSSPREKEPKDGHLPIFKWHRWASIDGANSLSWNFIGIPRKPSYSAPFLSYYFLAEFPSGAWVPTKPINFAWASKIGWGDLSASSPSGEREDACGLCRWWLVSHVNQVIQPLFLC